MRATLAPSTTPIKLHLLLFLAMVAALAGWMVNCRRRRDWSLLLGFQLIVAVLVHVLAELNSDAGENNHAMYNVYLLVEFALFFALASRFMDTAKGRLWTFLSGLPFLLVFVGELMYFGTFSHFASTASICGGFTFVGLFGFLLVRTVDRSSLPLQRSPIFWIFAGIVIYYAGAAPILGLVHYLMQRDRELAGSLYDINNGLAMVRYVAMAVGFNLLTPAYKQW